MAGDYSFQDDAIHSLRRDFTSDPNGRFLLVIPTGGGKTLTAIRFINDKLHRGELSSDDVVLWVVHRKALKAQTEGWLNKPWAKAQFDFHSDLARVLRPVMKGEAAKVISRTDVAMIIIDEAHHSAANTYGQFFELRSKPILGLTATPTRNDDRSLSFDKISYSITFRRLIDRGVIVKPEFVQVDTNITYEFSDFSSASGFNTEGRNRLIAQELVKRASRFRKAVVFVSSNQHVEDLYAEIEKQNKFYGSPFQHVGFVHSSGNERGLEANEYLNWHKGLESSILVNCQMLNEGYDDPKIDCVAMGTPTESILYYMQCIGRAVRSISDQDRSRATVIEFNDNLPNVRYRVDNQWLFADISDYLEPVIHEIEYRDAEHLGELLEGELSSFSTGKSVDLETLFADPEEHSLLLFCSTKDLGRPGAWSSVVIGPTNREQYVSWFNDLSNNISTYKDNYNEEYLLRERLRVPEEDPYFGKLVWFRSLHAALRRAYEEKQDHKKVERLHYFTFVQVNSVSEALRDFLDGCYNQMEITDTLLDNEVDDYVTVFKYPLVTGVFKAIALDGGQAAFLQSLSDRISEISEMGPEQHEDSVMRLYSQLESLPIPIKAYEGYLRAHALGSVKLFSIKQDKVIL